MISQFFEFMVGSYRFYKFKMWLYLLTLILAVVFIIVWASAGANPFASKSPSNSVFNIKVTLIIIGVIGGIFLLINWFMSLATYSYFNKMLIYTETYQLGSDYVLMLNSYKNSALLSIVLGLIGLIPLMMFVEHSIFTNLKQFVNLLEYCEDSSEENPDEPYSDSLGAAEAEILS